MKAWWSAAVSMIALGGAGLGLSAPARADGVWVGEDAVERKDGPVVVELRKGWLVVSDAAGVWQGKAHFEVAGPGTKGGDLTFDVDVAVAGGATRAGLALKGYAKGRKVLGKWQENSLDGHLSACLSLPGARPSRPPRAADHPTPGSRCFTAARVSDLSIAPVPPAAVEPDFECMRECRQHSQMKAISIDAIEAECRATCTPK